MVLMQGLIGGTRLVFSEPAYGLLGVAAVLAAVLPGKIRMPSRPWCLWLTMVLFAYVVGRALTSPVEYLARFHLFEALGVMAAYLLVASRFADQSLRLIIVGTLIAVGVPHLIVAGLQFSHPDNSFHFLGIMRPDWGWRASGMLMCPTSFSDIMAILAVMSASVALWARIGWAGRMLSAYMVPAFLAGVAISGSRGGYLAVVLGFLCLVYLSLLAVRTADRGRAVWIALALVLIFAALIGGAFLWMWDRPEMRDRIQNVFDLKNMRIQMWEAAFVQWQQNPWFGTGSWTFYYFGRMFRPPGGYQADPIHAHNDYVHTLAEYGIIGFALVIVVVVVHAGSGLDTIKWLLRERLSPGIRRTSTTLALLIGTLSGLAVLMAHAVVDFNMHIPSTALVVGSWMGMLANPAAGESRRESLPNPAFAWTIRGVLIAIGLSLVGMTLRYLPSEIHAEKARVALRDGQWIEAVNFAKKGIALDATNPELHFHLGEARLDWAFSKKSPILRKSLAGGAVPPLERGLALYPYDMFRVISLGLAADLAGDPERAARAFARAVDLDPNSALPYYYRGLHFRQRGLMEEAKQDVLRSQKMGIGSLIRNADLKWAYAK